MQLTNADIVTHWHECILPEIYNQYEQDDVIDKPARRESWNDELDSLNRDGQITDAQASEFGLPDIYEDEFHPKLADALRAVACDADTWDFDNDTE